MTFYKVLKLHYICNYACIKQNTIFFFLIQMSPEIQKNTEDIFTSKVMKNA